jgi:hypothetical protein
LYGFISNSANGHNFRPFFRCGLFRSGNWILMESNMCSTSHYKLNTFLSLLIRGYIECLNLHFTTLAINVREGEENFIQDKKEQYTGFKNKKKHKSWFKARHTVEVHAIIGKLISSMNSITIFTWRTCGNRQQIIISSSKM